MSKANKIQKAKEQLEQELKKPNPDPEKVANLKKRIVFLGIGLTRGDIIKPY